MFNTTLAAVDLSHPKQHTKVLQVAAALAQTHSTRLYAITVIPDYGTSITMSGLEEPSNTQNIAQEMAGALRDYIEKALGSNNKVHPIIAHGKIYKEVLETASKIKTDLIVCGSHQPDLNDYLTNESGVK